MREYSGTVQAIVDSAVKLFNTKGYESVSVNDICKSAGIARSSFYRVFSSKHDILVYLLSITKWDSNSIMSAFLTAENDFERMWLLGDRALSVIEMLGPDTTGSIFQMELTMHYGFLEFQKDVDQWMIKLHKNCVKQRIVSTGAASEEIVPLVNKCVIQIAYDWCKCGGSFPLKKTVRRAAEVLYDVVPGYCWANS